MPKYFIAVLQFRCLGKARTRFDVRNRDIEWLKDTQQCTDVKIEPVKEIKETERKEKGRIKNLQHCKSQKKKRSTYIYILKWKKERSSTNAVKNCLSLGELERDLNVRIVC